MSQPVLNSCLPCVQINAWLTCVVQFHWPPSATLPWLMPQVVLPPGSVVDPSATAGSPGDGKSVSNPITGNASALPVSGKPIFEPAPFCSGLSHCCCCRVNPNVVCSSSVGLITES